jgi:hypothetical protein
VVDGSDRLPLRSVTGSHRDRMNRLNERLARLRHRITTTLRALSWTTFLGVSILVVTAISVTVLALLGAKAPSATVAQSAVPISMTRLVADAKAGRLANAVVDETGLVVQATYGPGAPRASAPPGPATDGGTLSAGAVANASVLSVYLPKVVDALVAGGVPVHPGTITGVEIVAPIKTTPAAAANAGMGKTSAATAAIASTATEGRFRWALGIGLLGLLAGSLVIALGSVWRKNHSQAGEPNERMGVSAMTTGGSGSRLLWRKKAPTVEPATVPETRFSDVAGCDEAKTELMELVMFLKEPDRPGPARPFWRAPSQASPGCPCSPLPAQTSSRSMSVLGLSASGRCSALRAGTSGPSSSSTRWTPWRAAVVGTARRLTSSPRRP